jgi:hypothetical protein
MNDKNVKIIAASGHLNLLNLLAAFEAAGVATATVEAEYGDVCVSGSWATLAHHGSRSANPVPCVEANRLDTPDLLMVGISHLDLDTLGGVLALLGVKPEAQDFWEAAARVDMEGPHMLPLITTCATVLAQLNAFWAWSEGNRLFLPHDGAAVDVTASVTVAAETVTKILGGDSTLLEAGKVWATGKEALDKASLRFEAGGLQYRVAEGWVNHLYGTKTRGILGYNPTKGKVTLSFVDDKAAGEFDAGKLLQEFFGPEAGGRKTVAGGPRDLHVEPWKAHFVALQIAARISGKDICLYCGTDTTDQRQGFDCCNCGSN